MNIFNDSLGLEEITFFAIDWAAFQRSTLHDVFAPFIILKNGKSISFRVMMTDENPKEYAKKILETELEKFEQFAIGFEGRTKNNIRGLEDSIIVYAFDKSLDEGVCLGQAFTPLEKGGIFKLIDRVSFLGKEKNPLISKKDDKSEFIENTVSLNLITLKNGDLLDIVGIFTHNSISLIRNEMKNLLFSKLSSEERNELSGKFELIITPFENLTNDRFLKFVINTFIEDLENRNEILNWVRETGRLVNLVVKFGDELVLTKEIKSLPEPQKEKKSNYSNLSDNELKDEFNRIIAIPNARTDFVALTQMSELLKEFEVRNIPNSIENAKKSRNGYTVFIIILIIAIIVYFIFR